VGEVGGGGFPADFTGGKRRRPLAVFVSEAHDYKRRERQREGEWRIFQEVDPAGSESSSANAGFQ